MRRTFNYTGRRRIPLTNVSFRVYQAEDGIRQFDARLSLSELGFDGASRVFVEAYYERFLMRFNFGTVAAILPPHNRRLEDLAFGGRVLFRVKIVAPGEGLGRIVGSADRIAPEENDQDDVARQAILPVNPVRNMGQEVWRVTFEGTDGPTLEVNAEVDDIMQIVKLDRMFSALVFPQVLRTILFQVLIVDRTPPEEESGDSWQGKWLKFVETFYTTPAIAYDLEDNNSEEVARWIEGAVSRFATHLKARDRFVFAQNEEL
jgi:hypothetical protein